jgi:hypothetical protein
MRVRPRRRTGTTGVLSASAADGVWVDIVYLL